MSAQIYFSRRIRKPPFEDRVHENGAKGFTVYNQLPLAALYHSLEEDYWHLREHVQLWDVHCEQQVEIRGPDALRLVELCTPREIAGCAVGQCIYAPLCDEHGGIVNDPLLLRLAEDRFWISIADSGVMLWMKGLAVGLGLDVEVFEPFVGPCALQGPKADVVLQQLVDIDVLSIKFFRFVELELAGTPVVIGRSGWSGQGGFEIYLQDPARGLDLWELLVEAGRPHEIRAGCPNLIERIESGLLSYGNDMTLENNIFECGLDRFVKLGKRAEYLSRTALDDVAAKGADIALVRVEFDGGKAPGLRSTWPVRNADQPVGFITSATWSPRFETNIGLASVSIEHAAIGQTLNILVGGETNPRSAIVVDQWPS